MASKRTNQGRNNVRDFLQGDISEIAVGTDATEPNQADTALGAEVFRAASSNVIAGTGKVRYVMRLGTGDANGETLTEAGTFDASGDLQTRHTFGGTPKSSGQEIEFRIEETGVNT